MTSKSPIPQNETGDLQARFDALETRLSKIEEFLDYRLRANLGSRESSEEISEEVKPRTETVSIESKFGENLFAWISGIVVLFLVVFIMSFFQSQDKDILAVTVGYAVTGAIILFSFLIRNSYKKQVYLLRVVCHILLYYITVRLHFFSENPIIENQGLGLIILALPIAYMLYFAFMQKAEVLVILGAAMLFTAVILSDQTNILLLLLSIIAAFGIYLHYLKGWSSLLHFSLFMVYLTHLLWILGNPLAGHPLQMVEEPQGNLLYLFSYGFIFSMIALQKPKTGFRQNVVTSITLWNGILFAGILLFEFPSFYSDNYSIIFAAITIFSLGYSALLKLKDSNIFITSFYAVVSFVAMSIMIYGWTGFPNAYLWLVLQSLLVVSIALWFRSPLIVIANTLMFIGLLVFYLIKGDIMNSTSLSFAIIAGLTARFIYWKRERLKLKTEAIRNAYLITLFFTALFALYHMVPDNYITISWVGLAGLFFVLSYLLKAKKYRWLAFGTLIVAVVYLFFFQLKSMELGFRILAFSVIAVITLAASFYYSRRSHN